MRSLDEINLSTGAEPRLNGLQEFQRMLGRELRQWGAALADRANRPANVWIPGDSMSEGAGARSYGERWMTQYGANMQNQYRLGAPGLIPPRQGTTLTFPNPWTNAGTPTLSDFGWGPGRRAVFQDTTDDISTLVTPSTCDRFYVLYTSSSATGTAKVTLDGTVLGTIATNDAFALSGRVWDSGAVPRGIHSIAVAPNAASNAVIVDGVMLFDGDTLLGVHIFDQSHSGYLAAHFNGSTVEDATSPASAGKRRFWADVGFQPVATSSFIAGVTATGTTTLTWPSVHGLDANDIGEPVWSSTDVVNFPKNVRVVSITDTTHAVVSKAIPAGSYNLRVHRSRTTAATTTSGQTAFTVDAPYALTKWDEGKTLKGTQWPTGTIVHRVTSATTAIASQAANATATGTAMVQITNRRKYSTNPHLLLLEFGFNEEQNGVPKATYKSDLQAVYQTAVDGSFCDDPTMTGIYNDERPSVGLLGLWAHSFQANVNLLVDVTGGTTVTASAGTSARFTAADQGKSVTIPGGAGVTLNVSVPAGAYYTDTATLSSAATNGTNVTMTITNRQWQDGQWQDFRDAMRELAQANTWAFFDMYSIAEWVGTYDTIHLTDDKIHPNTRGHARIADVATQLFAGGQVYGAIPRGIFNNPGEIIVAGAADTPVVKPGIKRMSAQVVTTAVANAMADLTELAFPVGPNETVSFMINLLFTAAAATTGLVFDLNPSANMSAPAALNISTWAPASASTFSVLGRSDAAYGTDMVGTGSAATVPTLMQIIGTITGGAYGGTLTPRAAPEIAAAVTVLAGSWALVL